MEEKKNENYKNKKQTKKLNTYITEKNHQN